MLSFTLHFSAQQCNSQGINCVNENRIYSTQLGQLCHFSMALAFIFMYCLFVVLRRFQHCTGHITTGSWKGKGNQYIEFARVLYCKLPTNGKQLPAFPLTAMMGIEPRPQRWEARVLPLCTVAPILFLCIVMCSVYLVWIVITSFSKNYK